MRLCSICDNKMTGGTWCSTCKRFVKTYEINDEIHINESHILGKDAGCDYHTPNQKPISTAVPQNRTANTNYNRTTNTNNTGTVNHTATTTTRTTAATTEAQQKAAKRTKRVVLLIVLIWIGMTVLPILITALSALDGFDLSKIFSELKNKATNQETQIEADPSKVTKDLASWKSFCESMGIESVKNLLPDSYKREEEGVVYYFVPKDLSRKGRTSCDYYHFKKNLTSLKEGLVDAYKSSIRYSEVYSDVEDNYLYVDKNGNCSAVFDTTYLYELGDTEVYVSIDTVMEEIHQVAFYSDDDESMGETAYILLSILASTGDWTQEELTENIASATENLLASLANEEIGYEILLSSDNFVLELDVQRVDDAANRALYLYPTAEEQ